MQRVALINWKNINQDYDLAKIFSSLSTSWVIEWLEVQSWKVTPWYAFIDITRDSQTFPILFQNSDDVVIDATWTKKVYIEITQTNIDDWNNNNADWTWIWEIKINTSYPTTNYIKLASIIWGVITDEREYVTTKDVLNLTKQWNTFNWVNQLVQTNQTWKIDWELLESPLVKATQINLTAWESISISEALVVWKFIEWPQESMISQTQVSGTIYDSNTWPSRGQTFVTSSDTYKIKKISVYWKKAWTPDGNMTLTIWDSPSKTISYWTSGQLCTNFTTSDAFLDFTFDDEVSASTSLYFELTHDGTHDASNKYRMTYKNSNPYSWGDLYVNWTKQDPSDAVFKIEDVSSNSENDWELYLSDASDTWKLEFIWFSNSTYSLWETSKVNTSWIAWWFTWLIINEEYYLSDTPWQISTTPWTNEIKVWRAISTTELEIIPLWKKSETWLLVDSTNETRSITASSWTVTYNHWLWVIPSLIQVFAYFIDQRNSTWTRINDWNNTNKSVALKDNVPVYVTSAIYVKETDNDWQVWKIQNVTDTTFDVVWTYTAVPSGWTIQLLFNFFK